MSTLAAYLNSLQNNSVHIVTVNDYLAKRDSEWMGVVYEKLGLKTGYIVNGMDESERKGILFRHNVWHKQRVWIRLPKRQYEILERPISAKRLQLCNYR